MKDNSNNLCAACAFHATGNKINSQHVNSLTEIEFVKSINKVVFPIRRAMKNIKNEFKGDFSKNCQQNCVPTELLTLISMLIDGNNVLDVTSQCVSTCAQIIIYNFHARVKQMNPSTSSLENQDNSGRYHSVSRGTPAVIYTAIKIYATVKSDTLINKLFSLGICIPYKRIITKDISEYNLQQYDIDNVYSVIAKDNIDLNTSSTTAKSHSHGTSMSMLNFPSNDNPGIPIGNDFGIDSKHNKESLKVDVIPEPYSVVKRLNLANLPVIYAPLCTTNLS